jgi:nicotinamidase-related amidase
VTVVLGGIATNYGVESTARDAFERGYHLVLVEDAMGARSAADHAFACERIFPRLGRLSSTTEVLAALSA